MRMGAQESKPVTQVTHEQILNLINTNEKSNVHAETSAKAQLIVAYIAIFVVIATGLYFVYRLITKYERMRGEARIEGLHGVRISL